MTESYDNPSTRPPGTLPTSGDLDDTPLDDTLPPSYPAGSGTYETGTLGTTTYQGAHVADDSSSSSGAKEKVAGAKDKAGEVKNQVAGEAQNVKQTAVEAGSRVAGTAKEQAATVAGEAKNQAKDMLNQARTQLTSQAGTQQQNLAGAIRTIGGELGTMASSSEQPGVASNLANQAAGVVDSVASWFENKEPADLVTEVTTFARQRPGAFLAIAAGTGFVLGRLARSLKDDASDDTDVAGQPQDLDSGYTTGTTAGYSTDAYAADTYTAPTTSAYGTTTYGTPDVPGTTTGGYGGTA